MMATADRTWEVREVYSTEEADAWFEYLEQTTGLDGSHYSEVEGWAWARLESKLRMIQRRRDREQRREQRKQQLSR